MLTNLRLAGGPLEPRLTGTDESRAGCETGPSILARIGAAHIVNWKARVKGNLRKAM